MRKPTLVAVALGSLTLAAARHRAVKPPAAPPQINIDIHRSLVITDPAILSSFDFQRVLQALIDRGAATSTTPLSLYRQWFDTQNPKPGLAVADAPHCDDFLTDGKPSFNGFPRLCPTPEGVLATTDPFTAHDYTPIGITNRFDLIPVDGSNCGQYRIIYAKTTNAPSSKLHIIFEPTLRNPNPSAGVEGCRAVAQFWADLSKIDSADERRARIEKFFFDGIDGFDPVLLPSRYAKGSGGIRTSQNQQGAVRFYQFHLQQDGSRLLVVPGLLQDMSYGPLYNAAAPLALGPDFRQFFISQIQTLAIRDTNGFFDDIPDKYLMTESAQDNTEVTFASGSDFFAGQTTPDGQAFKTAITAELQRVGSTIALFDVLNRADLQNCHGCHFDGGRGAPATAVPVGEGVMFPLAAQGGTHIDETLDAGSFTISAALRDVYAPNRARILIDFLNRKPLPAHSNTLGGGRTSD
jgi:hypothetical protein